MIMEKSPASLVTYDSVTHKLVCDNSHQIWCLPEEISIKIFSYLDVPSIDSCSKVCKGWNKLIQSQCLWREKILGLPESQIKQNVLAMKAKGTPWKESYKKNHDALKTRQLWYESHFSNLQHPKSERIVCPMSVEEWGTVLEMELSR